MKTSLRKRLSVGAAITAALLMLSGCNTDIKFKVIDADTVEGSTIIEISQSELDELGVLGDITCADLADDGETEVRDLSSGDGLKCEMSISPDEMTEVADSVSQEGDQLVLFLDSDISEEVSEELKKSMKEFSDSTQPVKMNFIFEMPGKIREATVDGAPADVSGNTAIVPLTSMTGDLKIVSDLEGGVPEPTKNVFEDNQEGSDSTLEDALESKATDTAKKVASTVGMWLLITGIVAFVLVIAVIVIIIVVVKKNKNKNQVDPFAQQYGQAPYGPAGSPYGQPGPQYGQPGQPGQPFQPGQQPFVQPNQPGQPVPQNYGQPNQPGQPVMQTGQPGMPTNGPAQANETTYGQSGPQSFGQNSQPGQPFQPGQPGPTGPQDYGNQAGEPGQPPQPGQQ